MSSTFRKSGGVPDHVRKYNRRIHEEANIINSRDEKPQEGATRNKTQGPSNDGGAYRKYGRARPQTKTGRRGEGEAQANLRNPLAFPVRELLVRWRIYRNETGHAPGERP